MHNILVVALLLTITLSSCTPNMALPTTVINPDSPFPAETIESTSFGMTSLTATPLPFKSIVSPNGKFIAQAYFENQLSPGQPTIEIQDKKGKLLWQIPFQGEIPAGDPHKSLDILQWSNDSSLLYFYYVLSPDGGDQAFWWTGLDLQKLNMKTGEVEKVLPGEGFMSFAISPDGKQIAYTRQQDRPSIFYIRDLSTSSEKVADVIGSKNYVRVGDIHWSPNGKAIAFQTETVDHSIQTIHLNPTTMEQRVIQEFKLYAGFFDGWVDNGKLQFSEVSANGTRIVSVFQVDTATLEVLVIGTPTSRP